MLNAVCMLPELCSPYTHSPSLTLPDIVFVLCCLLHTILRTLDIKFLHFIVSKIKLAIQISLLVALVIRRKCKNVSTEEVCELLLFVTV
jgi:hypothetical protein